MRTPTQLAAIWPPNGTVARAAGHKPTSPLRAIRAKCLDCCCDQPGEVELAKPSAARSGRSGQDGTPGTVRVEKPRPIPWF